MTPIERLAAACWEIPESAWLTQTQYRRDYLSENARNILTKLRAMATDPEIAEAGARVISRGTWFARSYAENAFTAMIDHILNEGGGSGDTPSR
jgi:hypothetical protein